MNNGIKKSIVNHINILKIVIKMKKFYKKCTFFLIFWAVLFSFNSAFAALTSVSLSVPARTVMSNGQGYFLASENNIRIYNFDVSAVNGGATLQTDYDYFRIEVPTADGPIQITWNAQTSAVTYNTNNVLNLANPPSLVAGTWANPTVRFEVIVEWSATEYTVPGAANNVIATVKEFPGATILTDTQAEFYGICSNIRVVNFAQNNQAADALIPPVHGGFNVTGTVVYDIPGFGAEAVADAVNNADITALTLRLNPSSTDFGGGAVAGFSVAIADNNVPSGAHNWTIRGTMTGAAAVETSTNNLILNCNRVLVTNIEFVGGLGRGPTHAAPDNITEYYREYEQPGTLIRITAQMEADTGAGTGMYGATTFTVQYTDGTNTPNFTTVTIANGATQATGIIPYDNSGGVNNFDPTFIADTTIETWTYTAVSCTGSIFGITPGLTLTLAATNMTTVSETIYWDRNHIYNSLPLVDPDFQVFAPTRTAVTATFFWFPITVTDTNNGDFYEYKLYFRKNGTSDPWTIWDGDNDSTLRFPNQASNILSGRKYTTIGGLDIFTEYEYYMTFVDIFGNEIPDASANPVGADRLFRTQPFSIDVRLSDGITSYENTTFIDLTPTVRPLRATNIRVDLNIITSNELPDIVRLWYTTGDISAAPDIVNTSSNTINSAAFAANTLFSATAQRTSANTWTAYLSTDSGILTQGASIRFVLENVLNNVSTFIDYDILDEDPNDDEWTLYIEKEPKLTPWPVRILNNVITKKNPVAYPSYYLNADAYVTIKVYDIKGRPVATILDKALRRGGHNIKENGWRGKNKVGKKLGIGLYYIQIKAKRVSDGKIIINKFKKVVMAR